MCSLGCFEDAHREEVDPPAATRFIGTLDEGSHAHATGRAQSRILDGQSAIKEQDKVVREKEGPPKAMTQMQSTDPGRQMPPRITMQEKTGAQYVVVRENPQNPKDQVISRFTICGKSRRQTKLKYLIILR
jgi:hypothetical protein